MPPLRPAILEDVAAHPHSRTKEVRYRLNKPSTTIDRQLKALDMLNVLTCEEVETSQQGKSSWYYGVMPSINADVIRVPEKSVVALKDYKEDDSEEVHASTHISGTPGTGAAA